MSRGETLRRYGVFLVGLAVMALAVSVLAKAGLGISPVQSLAYVVYSRLSAWVTLGATVFCWNTIQVLLQWPLLGCFGWQQWIQVPLSLFLSVLVDITGWMLSPLELSTLPARLCAMAVGILILAFAVSLTVSAGVVMNAGEALVHALAQRLKRPFGTVKEFFDLSVVTLSVLLSLLFFGKWRWDIVGVGTLCASLFTGLAVRQIDKWIKPAVQRICTATKGETR